MNRDFKNAIENPEDKENVNSLNKIDTTKPNTLAIKDIKLQRQVPISPVEAPENTGEEQQESQSMIEEVQLFTNNQEPPKKKKLDYITRENSNLISVYGAEMYHYAKFLENETVSSQFLNKHKVDSVTRTKMVDWMLEVLNVFKCEDDTFFLSVHIMDLYINKSQSCLTSDDIHLIGITAMFIASKFEDVVPLRLSSVVSKIGHNLFSE